MSEWRECFLAELAESTVDGPFGSALKSEHYVEDPGVRVVRLANLGDGTYLDGDDAYIADDYATVLQRHAVVAGDVLVASLGDDNHRPGRACQYPAHHEAGIVKADCFRVRPKNSVDGLFLKEALNSEDAVVQVRRLAQGVTRDRINLGQLRRIRLRMPPMEEQRRIAEILDYIDETIQATARVIAKLELVLDGVAQSVPLGDPVGRIAGDSLGSFSSSRSGRTPSRSIDHYYGGGIPWVKSGEVAGSTIVSTAETLSPSAVRDCGMLYVQPGTPLVAMYGATAGKVGWLGVKATTNQAVLAIEADRRKADPRWLYWALRTGAARLLNSVQGSGQPNLNKGIIERLMFVLPTLDGQRVAVQRLDAAESAIARHADVLAKLRRVRSGLAADLLSGHVRTVVP